MRLAAGSHNLSEARTLSRHNGDGLVTRATDYAYDALGQLSHVGAPEVSYDYSYDNAQRLQTVTDSRPSTGQAKTLTYRHSPGGLLDSLEDSEGKRQDYLYDAVGRLSAIQAGGERIDFIYDAGGRLQETRLGNGGNSLYRYNAGGDLEALINRAANGAEVSHHKYGYDDQGRRNSHLETVAGAVTDYRYGYDTLNRLRTVSTQNGATSTQVEAYQYDAYGNRRQRTAQDGSVRHYLYDAAQQLSQVRSGSDTGTVLSSYAYDDAGNQTQRTGGASLTLGYDALDRLASAGGTGFATETYRYDPQGRRIETSSGGTAKRFVYAGQSIWSEYGNDWANAQAHYVHAGLDRPLLRIAANDTAYYHADGLGSVVATSNAAGQITASARYDAFGQTLAKTGSIPRYGYTGREPDASGLIYYRARAYDPSLGRFAQRDPAGFADGINPYAYVGNNPISFSDPLGLMKAAPSIWTAPSYPGGGSSRSSPFNSNFFTGQSYLVADASGKVPVMGGELDYCGVGKLCSKAGQPPSPGELLGLGTTVGSTMVAPEAKIGGMVLGGVVKGVTKSAANFGSMSKLTGHFETHGAEFGAKSADEYLSIAQDVMKNGTKVQYPYKGETRTGYVQLMGNNRKGESKFAFVGTNSQGQITTLHTKSGKDLWKTLNSDPAVKTIYPAP